MNEPTWSEVVAYAISGLERGEWPYVTAAVLGLLLVLVRILVSWAWATHVQAQQLSIVRAIFDRWVDDLQQPFWTLSTASQMDAVARLRAALTGDVDMVIGLLLALRVHLETYPLDEEVLRAVDALTSDWESKTIHARRRRYRKLRELGKQTGNLPAGGSRAGNR